jgi:hypothetical protein
MIVLKKAGIVFVSSVIGLMAGVAIAAPVIASMNYLGNDGPFFPPPLVALGFLALPVSFLLLPVQIVAVGFELVSKRSIRGAWFLLALAGGAGAGLAWSFLLNPTPPDLVLPSALMVFGILQALLAFSVHWVGSRLRFAQPPPSGR